MISSDGQREVVARVRTLQRRRAAGASQIDEHDVARSPHLLEESRRRRGKTARALPGTAGEEEQRVGIDQPAQCRQHRDLNLECGARCFARAIFEDLVDAALDLFGEAVQVTRLERKRRDRDPLARDDDEADDQDRESHTLTVRRPAETLQPGLLH